MSSDGAMWTGIDKPLVRGRISYDAVLILRDLMPLLDVVGLMFAAYASTNLYVAMQVHSASMADLWADYGKRAIAAAMLAPFLLYDSYAPNGLALRKKRPPLHSFSLRFLKFVSVVLAVGFATRSLDTLPRGLVVLWFAMGFSVTLSCRSMLSAYLRTLERKGILCETVAVVGAGPVADRLIRHLQQTKPARVRIVGVFDDTVAAQGSHYAFASTGTVADLVAMGQKRPIDWVLITLPCTAESHLLGLVHTLKSLAVRVGLCPQNVGLSVPYGVIGYVGDGLPVTVLADRPIKLWSAVMKTAEDMLLGALITMLLSPVLLLIAAAIKLDSPGPVLFKQRRHASNNIEFDVYKFRTMRWSPAGDYGVLRQTSRNDDRITRLGRILRASSLDELPQLLNVLRGEMSLVGPRPHAVNMRTEQQLGHEIIATYPHRHRVKPGITGWSQVNGSRGATETVEELRQRIELDLHYVENWSLMFDIKILLMTFWVVLRRTNAR
jgi:Undecaprenyl-phosphate glucose phosphotransferase